MSTALRALIIEDESPSAHAMECQFILLDCEVVHELISAGEAQIPQLASIEKPVSQDQLRALVEKARA